jgi:hypothetical protein
MTVITMSRTEIDRMSVLRDLTEGRIKVIGSQLRDMVQKEVQFQTRAPSTPPTPR